MKAIRVHGFGGPEVLKLEEVATPKRQVARCWCAYMQPGKLPWLGMSKKVAT